MRVDCKISDYYEHIKNDGRLMPFYEIVARFENVQNCGLKSGKINDCAIAH